MDWYTSEIIDGLTKLMSLSLERTPAADMVQITAATWIDASTADRSWDQRRDTPRIRAAFSTLARTSLQWPAPRHFLDALPRVEQRAIGYEVKPLPPAEADARLAALRAELDAAPKPAPKAESPKREGPPLTEVEADLRQHYADRKTLAAGPDR